MVLPVPPLPPLPPVQPLPQELECLGPKISVEPIAIDPAIPVKSEFDKVLDDILQQVPTPEQQDPTPDQDPTPEQAEPCGRPQRRTLAINCITVPSNPDFDGTASELSTFMPVSLPERDREFCGRLLELVKDMPKYYPEAKGMVPSLVRVLKTLNGPVTNDISLAKPELKRECVQRSESSNSLTSSAPTAPVKVMKTAISPSAMDKLNGILSRHILMFKNAGSHLCKEAENQRFGYLLRALHKRRIVDVIELNLRDKLEVEKRLLEQDQLQQKQDQSAAEIKGDDDDPSDESAEGLTEKEMCELRQMAGMVQYDEFVARLLQDDTSMQSIFQKMRAINAKDKDKTKVTILSEEKSIDPEQDLSAVGPTDPEQDSSAVGPTGRNVEPAIETEVKTEVKWAVCYHCGQPTGRGPSDSDQQSQQPGCGVVIDGGNSGGNSGEDGGGGELAAALEEIKRLETKLRHKDFLFTKLKEQFKEREAHWRKMRNGYESAVHDAISAQKQAERSTKLERNTNRRNLAKARSRRNSLPEDPIADF
jgi:hypothetical protein